MSITVTLDDEVQAWIASQGKSGTNVIDYMLNGEIVFWNTPKLGPQPTADQLASVSTQAQQVAINRVLGEGEAAIQAWLDQTALSFGYDDIISACTYRGTPTDLWNRQAAAFTSWRDAVWQQAISQQNAVKAGTEQPPATVADLIASLPQPAIPTS